MTTLAAAMLSAGIATMPVAPAPELQPSIRSYAQSAFKDAAFSQVKTMANQRELRKINKDFAQSYRFKDVTVYMKEPFKLRMESKVDGRAIYFILNGPRRMVKIPSAGLNTKENLAKAPGKRQTAFDFGIITPAMFNTLFDAKYIRKDSRTGNHVYDLTYKKGLDDTSRFRVWVDPNKKHLTRQEKYSQNGGHLVFIAEYSSSKQVNGVWFPTVMTVKNSENKVAGKAQVKNLRVNIGLKETLFNAS